MAQARRRHLKRFVLAAVLGAVVAAYTYGALGERTDPGDWNDLLPQWIEASVLGVVFALASLPVAGATVARAIIPVPTFLLYLTVLLGKDPALPYYAAVPLAITYAGALTVLSAYLAERPERPRLGSRR
jgi:drug/metabolite transporter (DMT)-like permease